MKVMKINSMGEYSKIYTCIEASEVKSEAAMYL